MISLIVAVSTNGVIGRGGELPWRLSADLRRFKALTMGRPIVMGRRTHESIGKALPGRHNIVITRQPDYLAEGCTVVASAEAAIEAAGSAEEIMVIGGGDIYALFLHLADRIYLTRVEADVVGDAYFPALDEDEWVEMGREQRRADRSNDYDYAFVMLDRVRET